MMNGNEYLLGGFEPRNVLRRFEDVCRIPHGTGFEAQLGGYVMELAREQALLCTQDAAGNVLVRVPASPGCEQAAPLLLQGHLDMVLAKEPGVELDLRTQPVRLVLEGSVLRADGTTLGADNAAGLCFMLALMEPDAPVHPPLELLFTVEEEIGMLGARRFDMSLLRARRMINMDCGDPDVLVIAAAGSTKFDLRKEHARTLEDGSALRIRIDGLRGGHSGTEAGKNRASAIDLTGRLLSALCGRSGVRLCAMDSPEHTAGFPRWQTMTLCVPPGQTDAVRSVLREMDREFSSELSEQEPGYRLTAEECRMEPALSAQDTRALADFLLLIPFDTSRRDTKRPDWILCSSLISRAALTDGVFEGFFSTRANKITDRNAVVARLTALCRMTGVTARMRGEPSPAWQKREDSPLRELVLRLYKEQTGQEMELQIENGAVEVGAITERIPDMDAVGFAPFARGAHTTREYLRVDTVLPVWELLKSILAALGRSSF